MTRGWFDLFRDHGGPTLYPESNRTSVIADVQALTVYIVFATLLVAFFCGNARNSKPKIQGQYTVHHLYKCASQFICGRNYLGWNLWLRMACG